MTRFSTKDIVFINQDSGYLMIDIINEYANAGFNCVLITGRLVERNHRLHDSVKTEVIIKYNRSSIIRRVITSLLATLQILWIIRTRYYKSTLFIVSNPPFAPLLPLFLKNPYSILIYDIYPDTLSELGYVNQKSWLVKLWKRANEKSFNKAERIFTISEGMKNVLMKYLIDNEPEVIAIWTDNHFLKPVQPKCNPFIEKHNLTGKFIVMYSGNLGLSSDVDVLTRLAIKIRRDDIVFVIIGEGARKEMISRTIASQKLKNVILLPLQPPDVLPYSLSAASLAVITVGKKVSKLAVPSKFYNYLSVGAPIMCISSGESEIDALVNRYACGRIFESTDLDRMINYIAELADNPDLHNTIKSNSMKASEDFQVVNVKKFLPPYNSKVTEKVILESND